MRSVGKSPILAVAVALTVAAAGAPAGVGAQERVVRAVLFYSPACPHCHEVMTEDLPPLVDRYGDRLAILGVDVTSRSGQALLRAAADHFGIPAGDVGVPFMVVGETFMIGAVEIPERLPGIIERALAAEGVDWPEIGALREALAAQGLLDEQPEAPEIEDGAGAAEAEAPVAVPADAAAQAPADAATQGPAQAAAEAAADAPAPGGAPPPAASTPAPPEGASTDEALIPAGVTRSLTPDAAASRTTVVQRLQRDPVGNGVAVVVLVGLLAALVASVRGVRPSGSGSQAVPPWVVPALCLLGMGVAAYLSFVEVTGGRAVCGPVGDCNAVQQSPYARLFGVLPVGILGLVGYAVILAAWAVGRGGPSAVRGPALRLRWAMAFAATAFSVYLTFLEPFVIGATCAWCITSAVVVALLLLATTVEMRGAATA
jgi:uncharacterized membrane protein